MYRRCYYYCCCCCCWCAQVTQWFTNWRTRNKVMLEQMQVNTISNKKKKLVHGADDDSDY
jgi:hypothetical protein